MPLKRRDFCAAATLAGAALTTTPLLAQAKVPQAGSDYAKLRKPAPVDAPAGKIEVIEFFWYSCPHCNAFEPVLNNWAQRLPKDVVFKRVPVAFQDSYLPQQRLFYALEAMDLTTKLHERVFAAIHVERQNLSTEAAITDWMAKQGVDKALFTSHFNSFTTVAKARRASQLMNAYEVEGVPALGVAGRFYTDGAMTKAMDRALQVVDFLVAEVRAGR
ncbi:thiol:disulfide interchange protein DsbA/DsbL [Rhodoferax fermentans]|uniref:Thiol:disulfide interchange protein n=1 Tax=Rhodoferax fermentans TaxID=28066 RepID=A0A1T1ARS8_RHOFE|nr:thiol:disulfide interchange protein DsbA/DsbL [Rhodoferax fermentans]MBK1683256.1 disulfide bond formation protein DsbA [Rhodoferax fermentans]OOV06675.1 disulfide bond formation protein DsbA [Rhodoferax fermentans]